MSKLSLDSAMVNKLKHREIDFDYLMCKAQYIQMIKMQYDIIEFLLRYRVAPPISGKITEGKIRWRGIRLGFCDGEMFLIQRGVPISFHIGDATEFIAWKTCRDGEERLREKRQEMMRYTECNQKNIK